MRETLCHSLPRIGGGLEVATVAKDTSQQLYFRDFGRPCSMHQRRHHRRRQCWSLPLSRVCFFSGINFSLIECSRKRRFLLTCQASHASHGAIINRQCCFDSPSLFLMMPAEILSRGTKRTSRMHHHHVTHALESPTLEEFNTEDVESEDVKIGGGQNGSSLQPQSKHNGFTHTNTVGILGGMAALATVDFLRKVVVATPPESDFVPFLVCSDPHVQRFAPVVVQNVKDKTRASAAKLTDVDESSPLSALLEKRRFLEQAGARLIVMPCHASHMWYDQLVEGCTVPFLHIADCVVDELKAMDLRPLEAGNRVKIGVLGTEATLAAGFYQERFKAQGFDIAVPDKTTMEHAGVPGLSALYRRDMVGARNLLRIAVHVLLVSAVNKVVLACHDMPTAFEPTDPLLLKCIDPIDALARATVKWAQAAKASSSSSTTSTSTSA